VPVPTAIPVVKIGERGVGTGYAITVHEVRDRIPPRQYIQPKDGSRWVALDVTIENTGTTPIIAQPFDVRLQSTDNRGYIIGVGSAEPALFNTNLSPGEAARGWVNYEVPTDAVLATLKYAPPGVQRVVTIDLR
jgi:hypothetical protein